MAALWPGCETPAPATHDAAAPRASAPPPAAAEDAGPSVLHTVAEGETLWEISRAYGVSVTQILEANHLRRRDIRRVQRGDTIRIPGATQLATVEAPEPEELPPITEGAYHELGEHETLWDVARLYDVSIDDLIARNQLDDEGVRMLRPGRSVIVPGVTAAQVARATRTRRQREDAPQRERAPEPEPERPRGFGHTVAAGETIWDLASAFGATVGEIMAANRLDETRARNLRPGSHLFIPGVERDRGGRVRRQLTGAQQRALAYAQRLGLGTRRAAGLLLHGRPDARWVRAASRGAGTRLPGSLRWPVANGWFVRGFGSGEGHYHLAFDIMGRMGWNVRAAAPGIVAYSGNELGGFGNLVMMIHPGGWVTLYGHNSANAVVPGQRVPRGGILAEVGATGNAMGPHSHFELIFRGKNCDPSVLFRPGVRHRNGRMTPLPRADWSRPDNPPERMRCYTRRHRPGRDSVASESFSENAGAE